MNLHFSIHPSPCIGACQPTPLAGTTERLSRGGVSLAVMLTPAVAFGGASVPAGNRLQFVSPDRQWEGGIHAMPRSTPTRGRVVLAISDAKRRIAMRLAADGEVDDADSDALLLLDFAAALAIKADYNRRISHNIEDYGEVTDGLLKEIRQFERDFAHVLPDAA